MAKQRIDISLGFSADVDQARNQIKRLSADLDSIIKKDRTNTFGDVLESELKAASAAAGELKAHLTAAFNANTGKIDLTKFYGSLKKANKNISDFAADLSSIGPKGTKAFFDVAKTISTAELPMIRLTDSLRKFGTTLANTARWQISSTLLNSLTSAVSNAVEYAQDLNESLNDIRIVTGQSVEEMDRFAEKANKAAKALSTTTNEYAKASLIYFQQGLSDTEVEKRTNTTIKLANVTGESAETVSEWMTAVWNNFDDGSRSLEHYADVMTALGAATASSSDEIAGGLEKFAAIAKTIGLSYEYAASALATVTAITRQSEDVVGTAFKTIFARMEGLTLGETLDDGTDLNKYSQSLATIGVNIKNANGDLKDMDIILNELGSRWDNLNQAQKVALAQTVGGMRQYNQLIALMDNWDYFQQNLTTAMTSTGELNKQADIYAESWEAASDRVTAAAESIYNELLNDEAFIAITNFFADFLEVIDGAIEGIGGLRGVLIGLSAVLLRTFSKDIVLGIEKMSTAFMGLTAGGRQKIKDMQTSAWESAKNFAYSSLDETKEDEKVKRVQTNFDIREAEANQALVINAEKLTFQEKAILEAKIKSLEIDRDRALELAKQTEELVKQKKIKQEERDSFKEISDKKSKDAFDITEKMKITSFISKDDKIDGRSKQGALIQISKLKDTLETIDNTEYIPNLEELEKQIIKGEKSAKQLEKMYQKLAETIGANLTSNVEKFDKEIEELNKSIDKSQKELDNLEGDINNSFSGIGEEIDLLSNKVPSTKESFVSLAGGITSIAFAAQSAGPMIEQVKDAFADGEFNFQSFLGALTSGAMILPSFISGIKEMGTGLQGLAMTQQAYNLLQTKDIDLKKAQQVLVALGIVTQGEANNLTQESVKTKIAEAFAQGKVTKATLAQIAANLGLQASLGPIIAIVAAVVAGIALLTVGIMGAVKAYNAHNIAATEAAEQAKTLAEMYDQVKQSYDNVKNSLSNYESALKGLQELTRGTIEFKEAVLGVNEEALKLIEELNLMAGTDWWYGADGEIIFGEGVLQAAREKKLQQQIQAYNNEQLGELTKREAQQNADEINLGRRLKDQSIFSIIEKAYLDNGSKVIDTEDALIDTLSKTINVNEQLEKSIRNNYKSIKDLILSNSALQEEQANFSLIVAKGLNADKEAYKSATKEEQNYIDAIVGGYLLNDQERAKPTYETEDGWGYYVYQGDVVKAESGGTEILTKLLPLLEAGVIEGTVIDAGISPDINSQYVDTYIKNDREYYDTRVVSYGELAKAWLDSQPALQQGQNEGQYFIKNDKIYQKVNGENIEQELTYDFLVDYLLKANSYNRSEEDIKEMGKFVQDYLKQGLIDSTKIVQQVYHGFDLDLSELAKYSQLEQDAFFNWLATTNKYDKSEIDSYRTELKEYRKRDINEVIKNSKDYSFATSRKNFNRILNSFGFENMEELYNSDITKEQLIKAIKADKISVLSGASYSSLLQGQTLDQKSNIISLISDFDWSGPFAIDSFLLKLEELGVVLNEETKLAWTEYATAMTEAANKNNAFGSSLDKVQNSISTFNNIITDKLNLGDIISDEDYEKLIEAFPLVNKYFAKVADGYALLDETSVIKEEFQSKYIDQLKEEANNLNELQEQFKNDSNLAKSLTNLNIEEGSLEQNQEKLKDFLNSIDNEETRLEFGRIIGFNVAGIEELNTAIDKTNETEMKEVATNLSNLRATLLSNTPAGQKALDTYIYNSVDSLEELKQVTEENIELYEKWYDVVLAREKAAIEALEEEFSLTKQLEREINLLNRKIDSTAKVKDRAWGTQRLNLIEREIGLQEEMIQKQNDLAAAYKEEAESFASTLSGVGIGFNTNGNLSGVGNFAGMSKEEAEETLETMQKYEESLNNLWDAQENSMEASMEAYDLRLEQLQYSIEMTVLSNQDNIKILERLLDKLTDKMFSAADRMNNLVSQAIEYAKQVEAFDAKNLFTAFGIKGDVTSVDAWAELFRKNTYADRNATYEQLKSSYESLTEIEVAMFDIAKNIADTLLEAFEETGDGFDRIEERTDVFKGVADSYKNIIGLTRDFTEIDSKMIQTLIDRRKDLSETSLVTAKAEYDKLLKNQQEAQEKFNKLTIEDSALASYWKKQLEELNSMVDSARTEFMTAWEEALQAAADAFRSSVEEIVMTFEKSMTGSFGTYAEMQKFYNQQSKVADIYLAPYEKMYELTKLTRKLDKDIDESDNVKARAQLMKLQDEINELQESQVGLSKEDLNFLQKKYDLRLAEIALEEAQKAKNTVTLQRNAEGGWGYVYTADENQIADAQQKYEDAFYQTYTSGMEQISSNESKLLEAIQSYLSEIQANEGDQEKLNKLQSTFGEEVIRYANEIDKAIANVNKEVENANIEGYEQIAFEETLLGELLGTYDSANAFQEDFLTKLNEQVLIPTTDSINSYKDSINSFLNLGGGDTSLGDVLTELEKENESLNSKVDEMFGSNDLESAVDGAFSEEVKAMFGYYEEVKEALDKILAALDAFAKANDIVPQETLSYDSPSSSWEPSSKKTYYTYDPVKGWQSTTNIALDTREDTGGDAVWEKDENGLDYNVYRDTSGKIYYDTIPFNTGGYTGAWGSEGRLAMLHQKELVLNAEDTENFLSALGILRSVVKMIDLRATANAFNASELKSNKVPAQSQTLEQQVNIHAEFPNVTNHYEIEEALNNIVNSASQYANRKI